MYIIGKNAKQFFPDLGQPALPDGQAGAGPAANAVNGLPLSCRQTEAAFPVPVQRPSAGRPLRR